MLHSSKENILKILEPDDKYTAVLFWDIIDVQQWDTEIGYLRNIKLQIDTELMLQLFIIWTLNCALIYSLSDIAEN